MTFDYINYWENNYKNGGNSGSGSYGPLATFKAEVINALIEEQGITSVMEFGCGDGHQLGLMKYGRYLGLDVSASAVQMCADRYQEDASKSFILYAPGAFVNRGYLQADLVVCLDVLYHITDDTDFISTLRDILAASSDWVVLYTRITDGPEAQVVSTIRDRNILQHLEQYEDFEQVVTIPQRYPDLSSAHFLILRRRFRPAEHGW